MVTTAVIMAAGLGSRFGKMTETMPKGFIEVRGMSMVIRTIETLINVVCNESSYYRNIQLFFSL